MQTFKLLGLLLTYPSQQLQDALADFDTVLQTEHVLSKKQLKKVQAFIKHQQSQDLIDWQEEYVRTFDRSRNHSLYLFEHIHGESRDRGTAMVDLKEMYVAKGLAIESNELPDYLPLFLEYLSFCSIEEAMDLMGEVVDIVATIAMHLQNNQSLYADVFMALQVLSNMKVDAEKVKEAVENAPKDPETFDELDAQWQEAEAFGTDTDCHSCASPQINESRVLSGEIQ